MSFIDTILEHFANRPSEMVVTEVHDTQLKPFTRGELLQLVQHIRGALRSSGVSPGDRVGLLASNSAHWIAADLAILAEGAIAVPLYARQAANELAFMLRDCDARLVLCGSGELLEGLRATGLETQLMLIETAITHEPTDAQVHPRTNSEVVTLVYTSGTSGDPKGAMITTQGVDFMLPVTQNALRDLMGPRAGSDRVFHYLPFCFMGSRIVLWTCLFRGGSIFLCTDLTRLANEMRHAAPHYFLNVPALLERVRTGVEKKIRESQPRPIVMLYDRAWNAYKRELNGSASLVDRGVLAIARKVLFPKVRKQIGENLVCLICGSAPLGEDTQRFFHMLSIPVYQVYGLTETTAIVTMDTPGRAVPGKVGFAIPGVEMKLGENDELLTRGANTFAGYWNKPEISAAAMDGEWFRTGDQCAIDADGNLTVFGRAGSVIVPTSGHNVVPEPIEQKLLEAIPGAEHVVVVGHARPFLAAVITGDVDDALIQRGVDQVNETLPHYRRIRSFVHSAEKLTPENGLLTANQKLRRKAIAKHFQASLDRLYA